jgi:preprotein translocase subunit SecD
VRRTSWYLTITLVVAIGTFLLTVFSGSSPVLGLDLQGGIEVRLQPVGKERPDAVLDKSVDIIRSRVDGLGVAETEVKRDGDQIVVALPGVKDRGKARRVVGKTAELRFRPVLATTACPASSSTSSTTSTTNPAATSSTSSAGPTSSSTPASGPGKSVRARAPGDPTTSTTVATPSTTVATPSTTAGDPTTSTTAPAASAPQITSAADNKRDATVVLCDRDGEVAYQLGPAALTGKGVSSASSQFQQGGEGWVVVLDLNSDGSAKFNQLAATSFPKSPPQNAVAIELDGIVQSAPAFQTSSFDGNVQISGDFSQSEAEDLATVLKFGALPVQLKELTTTSISPTLGRDQLSAGILAGAIGLALVALYMLVFYRILGLVVIGGLALTGMLLYTLLVYLGSSIGLTLTLAGVVGVIVSAGVTVDSYVVYFERLKDEVRTGRTIRSSVDRGFERSFKTILAADLVSLIGAAILYWQAIGSVRQFALLLGLSTLLDLIISYTYMHPLVQLMVRSNRLVTAKRFGIAAGLDTREVAQ